MSSSTTRTFIGLGVTDQGSVQWVDGQALSYDVQFDGTPSTEKNILMQSDGMYFVIVFLQVVGPECR